MLSVRNAEIADLGQIMKIYRYAQDYMIESGNPTQWGHFYPCALDYCKNISSNIRVDTHADNKTMQRLIEKNGFTKCGTIYVKNGTARIAYQWTKSLLRM